MKILHVAASTEGGACIAALRIHQGLLDAGIDSHFLTLEKHQSSLKNIHVINHAFSLVEKFLLKLGLIKSYNDEVAKLMKSINQNAEVLSLPFSEVDITTHPQYKDADIIHLHWVSGILDYKTFFTKNKKPVVWTLHDMQPFMGVFHYSMDLIKNPSLAETEKTIIQQKYNLIKNKNITIHVVCEYILKHSMDSQLFRGRKHHLTPYPIDTSVFKTGNKESAKLDLKLPVNKLCIGFISLKIKTPRKGLDILLRSVKNIFSLDIHLFCIGNSDGNLDIQNLGKVNDQELLIKAYNAADVIIIPSIEENFSNVFLESISCGTPVIAFNTGAMADHVTKGNLGIISEKMNEEGLTEAINKFIATKSTFSSEKIRKYAEENFSKPKVTKSYIQLYQEQL